MAAERPPGSRDTWGEVLNRSVIKRCVIAAVLVIPGALFAKGETSIAMVLASAVIGCVAVLISAMPLVLLVSSAWFIDIPKKAGEKRNDAALVATIALSSAGIATGILHGFILAPPSFVHLLVLALLAIGTLLLVRRQMSAPLPSTLLRHVNALVIPSGLLYGAIAGASTFPITLLVGGFSIASSIAARVIVSRSTPIDSDRDGSTLNLLLIVSACTSLVSLLVAPSVLPMVYPAIASVGCTAVAMFLSKKTTHVDQSPSLLKHVVTFALSFEVLALFLGSF